MNADLSIGELSEATHVPISAIRYYEVRGLVEPVGRVGGKRRFDRHAQDRLAFIRRAKQAGFTLEQIGVLLDDASGLSQEILADRLHELKRTRDELDKVISFLVEAVKCGCTAVAACSTIVDL